MSHPTSFPRQTLLTATAAAVAALLLSLSAPAPAQTSELADSDKDGIPDLLDNCTQVANPNQADLDNDLIGNACDADINNDGFVNAGDLAIQRANFGKPNALGDLNGDGFVNSADLALMRRAFGSKPGPSGLKRSAPTEDGRRVPVASDVQVLRFAEPLPDGRNALVRLRFDGFFSKQAPAAVTVFDNGDVDTLVKAGISPADLGRPNVLGPRGGAPVVLNDLGLFGDDKAGDGVFSGVAQVDLEGWQADARRFIERAREAKAQELLQFNGRAVVGVEKFDLDDAFEPEEKPLGLRFQLPHLGMVERLAIPLRKLKLFLPPTTDHRRTLMVTHTGVVQDPGRTFSPCTNAGAPAPIGNVNGVWSFKTLMTQMANTGVTGITPQVFVNDWLRSWLVPAAGAPHSDGVNVPFAIPARPALQTVINSLQPGWNPAIPATLDMNRLPFRLVAIVNRLDLGQTSPYGAGTPGELRFVFGLLERNPATGQCRPSDEMTVILEYKLPVTTCTGVKMLANQWINLNGMPPGTPAYNAALQALTVPVTTAGAMPGALNGSAIGQVRTNEARIGPMAGGLPWEMREFTLQRSPVHGMLRHETVKNTPQPVHNFSALLSNWIENHPGEAVPRQFMGTNFIGTANRYGPGAAPANPPWNGNPANSLTKRFNFSLNTCSGCHLSETGTSFTMVSGNHPLGAQATLAGFLTGITVNDAAYGPPPAGATHSFNDLWRRGQLLDQVAAKSCLVLPHLPIAHRPDLLPDDIRRLPESVFAPRHVH